MLKQLVEYTDFDDNRCVETLYFNLTKTELTENIHLKEDLEELQKQFSGPSRELTTKEIKQVLDLVKLWMRLSYGVRSADGKRFIKSEEQWVEFTQTAAYDAFLYSLFENAEKAFEFMLAIVPADIREQAGQETARLRAQASISEAAQNAQNTQAPTPPAPPAAMTTGVPTNPPVDIVVNEQSAQAQPTQEQMAAYLRDQQARGGLTPPGYLQG